MSNPFATTPHRAVKTISTTPSPKKIPSTSVRKPSDARPLPLKQNRCASCGKRHS
jgi:hypothetical protein